MENWQLATLVAQLFRCPDGELATGNFSVAATKKVLPVAARPILEATEMLLITIERSCLSVAARTGN